MWPRMLILHNAGSKEQIRAWTSNTPRKIGKEEPEPLRRCHAFFLGGAQTYCNKATFFFFQLTLLFSSFFVRSTQVRFVSYGREYQPSQRVRKRRHGFLARMKSRGGRKVIAARLLKGRKYLSH